MSDKITLTFFITQEDIINASKHINSFIAGKKQSKKGLLWALILPLYFFYGMFKCGCYTFWEAVYQTIQITLIAGTVIFVFILIFNFGVTKLLNLYSDWKLKKSLKKAESEDPADRKPTAYAFDKDKITTIYDGITDEHDWSGIDGIFEYPEGFLFLNKNKQVELLVPKRAFETDFKQKLFREFAKRKCGDKATVNLFSTT